MELPAGSLCAGWGQSVPLGDVPPNARAINSAFIRPCSDGPELPHEMPCPVHLLAVRVHIPLGPFLQYRTATATGAPSHIGKLSGTIPAKGYFLVKGGTNSTASTAPDLPSADASAPGFSPSGTTGTIVLARQATALNPLPTGSVVEPDNVADLLGYGTSNTFETQAAAAPSSNTDVRSLNRAPGTDSNNNAADFTLSTAITPGAANQASGTNATRGIKLDDGASTNFLRDSAAKAQVLPYLKPTDPVRVGSPVTFTTNVVLGYANNA